MGFIVVNKKRLFYVIQSFLAIIIGGFIYIIYRSETLLMFNWFSEFGLDNIIIELRLINKFNLLDWIIYSLPDALWIYSFTMIMLFIWDGSCNKRNFIWIVFAPVVGICGELLQLFGLPGTFDIYDLLLCIIFSILALIQVSECNLFKIKKII